MAFLLNFCVASALEFVTYFSKLLLRAQSRLELVQKFSSLWSGALFLITFGKTKVTENNSLPLVNNPLANSLLANSPLANNPMNF